MCLPCPWRCIFKGLRGRSKHCCQVIFIMGCSVGNALALMRVARPIIILILLSVVILPWLRLHNQPCALHLETVTTDGFDTVLVGQGHSQYMPQHFTVSASCCSPSAPAPLETSGGHPALPILFHHLMLELASYRSHLRIQPPQRPRQWRGLTQTLQNGPTASTRAWRILPTLVASDQPAGHRLQPKCVPLRACQCHTLSNAALILACSCSRGVVMTVASGRCTVQSCD